MEILSKRAAFISVHEALEHFKELQGPVTNIAEAHQAKRDRAKAKREDPSNIIEPGALELKWVGREETPGLKFVLDSAIQHWSRPDLKVLEQTTKGNQALTKALQELVLRKDQSKLTKVEILQIVDLQPRAAPELYTIIEDMYNRAEDDQVGEIIRLVKSCASALPPPAIEASAAGSTAAPNGVGTMEAGDWDEEDDEGMIYNDNMDGGAYEEDYEDGGDEHADIDE